MISSSHRMRISVLIVPLLIGAGGCVGDDGSNGVNAMDAASGADGGARQIGHDSTTAMDMIASDFGAVDATEDLLDAAALPPDMGAGPQPDTGFRCTRDFECNDGNPCTDDLCVEGACTNLSNDAICDDDLFCNGVERCEDGVCLAGVFPCPSEDVCDEDTRRCTACDTDEQCPSPEILRSTQCAFENICDQEGSNEERVATYSCVDNECAAVTEDRVARCERDSDGLPCGGGAMCADGLCPRDPLIRVVSSGWVNFNARFSAYCQETNQGCVVEGNRDRMDRGSMNMFCELTCPAESNIQFCCSNGSMPCVPNERLAPRAGVTIDSMSAIGFADTNCDVNAAEGQPVECLSLMGEGDALVECIFRRQ